MEGPQGDVHWSRADFTDVNPEDGFAYACAFCDSKGNITNDLPADNWNIHFEAEDDHTLVRIHITYKDLASLEQMIEMGFKEGFTMGLENLDGVLAA